MTDYSVGCGGDFTNNFEILLRMKPLKYVPNPTVIFILSLQRKVEGKHISLKQIRIMLVVSLETLC